MELGGAMVTASSDLRLAALEVVTAASKSKTFPSETELKVFKQALPYSLHCAAADERHKVGS
jgi:hypothetical protein